MSCSLVQRGALPLLPEAVRTRSALTCGADLVFALPAPCACAGAEAFARAGVALLAAAGCDGLVFGAETPDAALLMEAAELLDSDSYRAALKAQLAGGARSFAAARQAAAAQLASDERVAALLDKPNNNLAVEYCRAIRSLAPRMEAYPLPRQGADHGEALHSAHGQFASASALRKLWAEGGADAVAPYVPEAVFPLYQFFSQTEKVPLSVMQKFSMMNVSLDFTGCTFVYFNDEIIAVEEGDTTPYCYGVAADIGTTTAAVPGSCR